MDQTALLHLPEGMRLDQIQITEHGLLIEVRATSPTSCCPLCLEVSSSIHCHYSRTLRGSPGSTSPHRSQILLPQSLLQTESLCRAAPRLCRAFRQNDDPSLSADHLHWTGNLRQRGIPTRHPLGNTDHSSDDPAPHHGAA